MSRKLVVILCCCFLSATLVVITLYATTRKVLHERNSFIREYARFAAVRASETDIEFSSWYIAGISADHIYLGNITAPFHLLITNHTLTDTQRVKIRIKGIENPTVYKSATVKIEPPYFYLVDGKRPVVFRGELRTWEAEPFTYDSGAYFTLLTPVGKSSFAIRTNSSQTHEHILGKVQSDTPRIQLEPSLLQKQIDGIFCTDGMLLYNDNLKRLVYTYYYRNEFMVYDTNLNLDYRGHTIDTFSSAQVNVGYISSSNTRKLLDKESVNLKTCTSGNYLFVRSNLLAKNDIKKRFEYESVVDVYDLTDGSYRFSFTVPHHQGKIRIRDFQVFDNKIMVALYDHYIVRFDLQQKFFARYN